jgi:DNA-binding GntR family transcriptional regulator
MSRPGTFERVYAAIRDQLREGRFRPGERLEPAALSDELNASVTPVRDALHRLAGERLVEAPRHEGFRMPLLTEATLRHLYAWHRDLVLLAISVRNDREERLGEALERALGTALDQPSAESLFTALAHDSGNPEHGAAFEAVDARLQPLRRVESQLLDAAESESAEILEALRANDPRRLRNGLVRYHRRRQRLVPELLERLYSI